MTRKKQLTKIFLLVIVLVLGVWVSTRWGAWFGRHPEPAFFLSDSIQRVLLTPGEDGLHDRSLSWVTGSNEKHQLTLWHDSLILSRDTIEGHLISSQGGKTFAYTHSYSSLPEGEYSYLISNLRDSTIRWAETFSILPSPDSLQLIYIGDIQDREEGFTASWMDSLHARYPSPTALLYGGDLLERGHDRYWKIWYSSATSYAGSTPLIVCPGNHEYTKFPNAKIDPRWTSSFIYPSNGPKGFVGLHYYIDYPHLRIVSMDSQGILLGPSLLRSRSWLGKVLEEGRKKQKFQIVMFHHGIYNVRAGRIHPLMRYGLRSILREGADLVLSGHDHAYSRISHEAPPVYIISNSSQKCYRNGFDSIHDKLGSGMQLYCILKAKRDTLEYEAYTINHELYDKLLLSRDQKGILQIHDLGKDIPESFELQFGQRSKDIKKAKKYHREVEKRKAQKALVPAFQKK